MTQNVHAIGDRANGVVLDAFEAALAHANVTALRPRLEHAQILAKKDMARFGDLGGKPSFDDAPYAAHLTAISHPAHDTISYRERPAHPRVSIAHSNSYPSLPPPFRTPSLGTSRPLLGDPESLAEPSPLHPPRISDMWFAEDRLVRSIPVLTPIVRAPRC